LCIHVRDILFWHLETTNYKLVFILICLEEYQRHMPRKHKTSSSNGLATKKIKDKPTYKIIVLGSGGVGKVSYLDNHDI